MRAVRSFVVAVLATVVLALPAVVLADGRVALVVGNSTYAHIGRLPNPDNDAADMSAALRRLGFEVTTEFDADRVELTGALRAFTRRSAGADVSLVFYAGHGIEMDGVNYLVPVDARLERDVDVRFETVTVDDLLVSTSGASLRLVILDACRNNPLARSMQRTAATRTVSGGSFADLNEDLLGDETLVAYAAAAGTTAADGRGRNSPYTAALLSHLETPLEIGLLFRRVRAEVLAAGKRVVVSLDGGRVRVRRKKRGPKTKKGRNRFHTDWKEPKLLILYVVGDDGRPSQTWAPIIDGTLRGPEAVFALLLSYARQIGLNAADKVLFIADGAPWIWQRIQRLIAALGLSPTQVLGLIDFYHAAKQLSDAVKLRRWSATQRTRWLNRTRGLLKRARVDEVITALRELCRGRTAGKIRTHLNYFLKNRHRFAYTTMVGLGLPRGSGAVESAIRRVINLRIKGASIYWLPESVDAILLLRSFYKSGRWNCLQRMAMTPVGVSA